MKRVASVADRGIVTISSIPDAKRNASRTVGGGIILYLEREIYQEIFFRASMTQPFLASVARHEPSLDNFWEQHSPPTSNLNLGISVKI